MFKKLIFAIVIVFVMAQTSIATECPSINDIKNVNFDENIWHPLDVNNAEPISNAELATLAANINRIQMVEYKIDAAEGAAHCYYGTNNDWSEFYLASTSSLLPYGNNWHYLSDNLWQCQPGNKNNCEWRGVKL